MARQLIIGDIHGCYDELQALLDRAGLAPGDAIIALGDLIDRGPAPQRVLSFFQTQGNARAILGNHERKHLRWSQGGWAQCGASDHAAPIWSGVS